MNGNALVRLVEVSAAYGHTSALEDVDLAVGAGDFMCVVGPSGAGKTTLLKLLAGGMRPRAGSITHDGKPRIGYVPQVETVDWFFPVTVLEVVLMARLLRRRVPWPSANDVEAAIATMESLGLESDLHRRHIRELSGGQQQRVFIARAMLGRPQLLLLDEPASGVDAATRHDIVHLLHALHHDGVAIVSTTHDINGIAAHVPTVVCLNRRVVALGSPREVITPDSLEKTFGASMEVLLHAGVPVVLDHPHDAPVEEGHHEHAS